MLRRIYFLSPNIATTHKIVEDLLIHHVEEKHIHVIAKEGTPMEELPEASFLQKTDFVPALKRGMLAGWVVGILAGLIAAAVPGTGIIFGGGAALSIATAGVGFGGWISSMVGIGIPNSRLKKFEDAIEKNQLLVLIDVPLGKVDKIEELILSHHPSAKLEGVEPTIPAMP